MFSAKYHRRIGFLLAGLLTAFIAVLAQAQQPKDFRTPPAGPEPGIHGPRVYGVRPGHPFLYRIPCTGARPMRFSARDLPATLQLDPNTGVITGMAPAKPGKYSVVLQARNHHGKTRRSLTIVVGQTIGLTPQMGWNDWYTYYGHISDTDVRTAARAMIDSGMADYGYQFIDIDDCWARKPNSNDPQTGGPVRDAQGRILPNSRFPDMSALTAYIHSLGLKAGIYSSPGPLTCARYEGSYQHEQQDAAQFAQWGFDLLKYDLCSYSHVANTSQLAELQKPYRLMGGLLQHADRDVVLNMCEYGKGDVWQWGKQVGGNSWRTTGDLGLERGNSLPGFYRIGLANAELSEYAQPGGWNDPDYILIGMVGNARNQNAPARHTTLTPDEQYSYMSMWSLMASPLFFSGDMSKLDPFTLNVLCNPEVIDIDQDTLGRQARILRKTAQDLVLAKPLQDGSLAVGLFNLTEAPRTVSISWQDAQLTGAQRVRDVWRERNLGTARGSFSRTVAAHGVELVRLIPRHAKTGVSSAQLQ